MCKQSAEIQTRFYSYTPLHPETASSTRITLYSALCTDNLLVAGYPTLSTIFSDVVVQSCSQPSSASSVFSALHSPRTGGNFSSAGYYCKLSRRALEALDNIKASKTRRFPKIGYVETKTNFLRQGYWYGLQRLHGTYLRCRERSCGHSWWTRHVLATLDCFRYLSWCCCRTYILGKDVNNTDG
jgi:hypothetical protein